MTDEKGEASGCFVFGVLLGLTALIPMTFTINAFWTSAAIEHGAMRYNATTGVAEWVNEAEKTKP